MGGVYSYVYGEEVPEESSPKIRTVRTKQDNGIETVEAFFPSGKLNTRHTEFDGLKHGEHIMWDELGNIVRRERYNHGELLH